MNKMSFIDFEAEIKLACNETMCKAGRKDRRLPFSIKLSQILADAKMQ